jgi:hypothetical protein
MGITRKSTNVDCVKESQLGVKAAMRDDEKIRVGQPSPLAPSKTLLADFEHFASDYLQIAGPHPSEEIKKKALWYASVLTNYEERYRQEIAGRPEALAELHRILAKARRGLTVSLYSSEKDWPCHKLVLLDILTTMSEKQKRLRPAADRAAESEEVVTLEAQLSFNSHPHVRGASRALRVSYGW